MCVWLGKVPSVLLWYKNWAMVASVPVQFSIEGVWCNYVHYWVMEKQTLKTKSNTKCSERNPKINFRTGKSCFCFPWVSHSLQSSWIILAGTTLICVVQEASLMMVLPFCGAQMWPAPAWQDVCPCSIDLASAFWAPFLTSLASIPLVSLATWFMVAYFGFTATYRSRPMLLFAEFRHGSETEEWIKQSFGRKNKSDGCHHQTAWTKVKNEALTITKACVYSNGNVLQTLNGSALLSHCWTELHEESSDFWDAVRSVVHALEGFQ